MLQRAILTMGVTLAALLPGAPPAAAHPMPHSVIQLDVHEHSVHAELLLPVDDLRMASGVDLTSGAVSTTQEAALRMYLTAHVRPVTTDGAPWSVRVGAMSLTRAEQTSTGPYRELVVRAVLVPPDGGDVRRFTLAYDAIVHQVVTHMVLVSIAQDWAAGHIDGESSQVGAIRTDTRSMTVSPLEVDLGSGSGWRGFVAMVKLGGAHVAEGTDHLLFLLTLLLPAPLAAVGGRWRGVLSARSAVKRIGMITLAFTLGHSVALAVSTLSRLEFPSRPVEAFIAVSILISAVHAIRPLFPGREALLAGLFGLGHGMAFSVTLAEVRLSTGQLALSLFGFNVGIELVQLLLVGLALPVLLAAARLRVQPSLRTVGALLIAVAATGWLLDRLGWSNSVARTADAAGTHFPLVVAVLAGSSAAVGCWAIARRSSATLTAESISGPAPRRRSGACASCCGAARSPARSPRHSAPPHAAHGTGAAPATAPRQ